MTPDVRPAARGDADGIARVHIQAWRETYTRLLPPGALDEMDEEERSRRWAEMIDDDGTVVWVAVRGDAIVGWCSVSDRPGEDRPRDLALEGIYVIESELGTGAGQALLDAAIGTRPAFLWSAEDNPRAQAFYRRNAFVDDGTRQEHLMVGRHPIQIARFVR